MEIILSWVKSGLLFAVIASVILLLPPNKSYIKHISLVVGLLFILVMVHPIMEIFHLDAKAYVSYIENLLMLEKTQEGISKEQVEMYEESVSIQLLAVFRDNGYPIDEVQVRADLSGNVAEVHMKLSGAISQLESIEAYLRNVFGSEVKIYYEN